MTDPVEELLAEARRHGLDARHEGPWLLFVGNEVFLGRAPAEFGALRERAWWLVGEFLKEELGPGSRPERER